MSSEQFELIEVLNKLHYTRLKDEYGESSRPFILNPKDAFGLSAWGLMNTYVQTKKEEYKQPDKLMYLGRSIIVKNEGPPEIALSTAGAMRLEQRRQHPS